jgi:hypothetical protein
MTDDSSDRQLTDPQYQRAARLLGQKLGIDWRDLPAEQVNEYLRKIEIARAASSPGSRKIPHGDEPD